MSAAVPAELGGDGLDAQDLSRLLAALAHSCSSTALALAMHTHVVALLAWRWRHQGAPVDGLLRRVADEQIVLISSGGSDWLESSGTAQRTDGGFVVEATKGFASGVPAGTLLNTSAVYDDPEAGPTVLHFMVPLNAANVAIEPTWRAMGMRGTGSHQVRLSGFFVPDNAVAARRPKGRWHPLFHLVSMIAIPIIYSVYFGIGEALRDAAVAAAKRRPPTSSLIGRIGALETDLAGARYALADMLAASGGQPGPETTNRIFLDRANLVRALMDVAEKSLEIAQGGAICGQARSSASSATSRPPASTRSRPLPSRILQGGWRWGSILTGNRTGGREHPSSNCGRCTPLPRRTGGASCPFVGKVRPGLTPKIMGR